MADNRYVEDGWDVTEKKPSLYILELPRYSDWLLFLLMRGLAMITGKTPEGRVKIEATEQRPIITELGDVKWRCICCGGFFDMTQLSEMVIGSVVRMHYEKVTNLLHREKEEGSKAQPVMKRGLGCATCLVLYMKALDDVGQANRMRAANTLEASQIALKRQQEIWASLTPAERRAREKTSQQGTIKGKGDLKPFIDVFADGYHLQMRQDLEAEAKGG